MKIGVVVGKFQAPYITSTHQNLFNQVIKECDQLVIFLLDRQIGFSDLNPIPYAVREEMLMQNFWGKSNGSISIYPLQEQKYLSTLQDKLDAKLLEHWNPNHEFILYTGPNGLGEVYQGFCKVKKVYFEAGFTSRQLRNYAYDIESYDKEVVSGMIHAVGHKKPVCHNYVTSIVKARNGIVVVNQPEMKLLTLPVTELQSDDRDLVSASFRNINELVPKATLSTGRYITSLKIDDWRFRESEDFCMYHVVAHTLDEGDLTNVEITRGVLEAEQFESEYQPIINYLKIYYR